MAFPLTSTVRWDRGLHFEGASSSSLPVVIDHAPPLGEGQGHSPMELALMSLAACSGQTVMSLLVKMQQKVRAFSVLATGERREDHPRVFTSISLEFRVEGEALEREKIDKAVRLTEEKYCPVWAMLKPGVAISSAVVIEQEAS
jgi:putative redox protein